MRCGNVVISERRMIVRRGWEWRLEMNWSWWMGMFQLDER